jgi:hypothetical protein
VRDAYDHVVRDRTQRMIMDRSRLIGFQTIVNCATNAPVGAWGRWGCSILSNFRSSGSSPGRGTDRVSGWKSPPRGWPRMQHRRSPRLTR